MKKNIWMNLVACAAMMVGIFASCNTDVEGVIYNPDEAACYSFASTQMNVELTSEDQGVIRVPIYRGNVSDDAAVEITAEMDETASDIFRLTNSTVAFKSGEGIAYAELNFGSIDHLGATNKYAITLSLAADKRSPSAEGTIKVQAQRQLTWANIGTGVYYSELFGESWDQPVEKAQEGNIYRLPDCIYEGYPLVFTLSDDGQELVAWDLQPMGYRHSTYGMVYYLAQGMVRQGNTLSFPMIGAVEYNGGYAALFTDFTEHLQLP